MNRACAPLLLLALLACHPGPRIHATHEARSQDSRVQFLILHFTNENFEDSLRILTQQNVSSHYLIRESPVEVHRLVPESRRAYHAGASSWKGQTMLNAASIGIEIVNAGDHKGPDGALVYAPYPEAQIEVVVALVKDIVKRHGIPPARVLGHSDIAPQRKVDPGPRFPWKRLADEGLVLWPEAGEVARRRPAFEQTLPDLAWFQQKLAEHGFEVPRTGTLDDPTRRVIAAFQMKYRPARYDGVPDAETAALLSVLTDPKGVKP